MDWYKVALKALGAEPVYKDARLPLTEADILQVEAQIGQRLPDPFREFFASCSGHAAPGGMSCRPLRASKQNEELTVRVFLGGANFEGYELADYYQTYRQRIPANLLPIALSTDADLICIATSGPMAGAIYCWDGDEQWKFFHPVGVDANEDKNVYLVAASFDEFINCLETSESCCLQLETKLKIDEVINLLCPLGLEKQKSILPPNLPAFMLRYIDSAAKSEHLYAVARNIDDISQDIAEEKYGFRPTVSIGFSIHIGGKANVAAGINGMTDAVALLLRQEHGGALLRYAEQTIVLSRIGGVLNFDLSGDVSAHCRRIVRRLVEKLNAADG